VFSANILELFASLIPGSFVDNIKYKFTINIKYINNNKVIKIDIIFKVKLEFT
jgi:hypothetical protein